MSIYEVSFTLTQTERVVADSDRQAADALIRLLQAKFPKRWKLLQVIRIEPPLPPEAPDPEPPQRPPFGPPVGGGSPQTPAIPTLQERSTEAA